MEGEETALRETQPQKSVEQGASRWPGDSQDHGHAFSQACTVWPAHSTELQSLGDGPGRKVTFKHQVCLGIVEESVVGV